ncbi:glycosyltransferase [Peribacillus sp. NJ4]|uniref:glycosyltransferase n=1 Tax=Peribacillus sp. NJ4 TaxID=3055862 RepID=UPI0025A19761|nr:glycosyltransferase [Peribacillus sp. NJ4]MDM5211552.1 glycosyltransferase [Peribacillus sp. NJ4]
MKILHYSLGLPPYRSGGLTKYSLDLIQSQTSQGQQVFLLFPGSFSVSQKTKIKPSLDYEGIQVFEIINPLPVSLLGGVIKPQAFMKRANSNNGYKSFLSEIQPDIIHIHTLMGIHKEFFMVAKELNIKIVYTTHDYNGICPKVNLIDVNEEVCTDNESGNKCVSCNQNAYSLPLIYLMQTKTYRTIKDKKLVEKLRRRKNKNINIKNSNKSIQTKKVNLVLADKFISLRDYYFEIFRFIDFFHFNSETTKDEFKRYLDLKGVVMSISHNNILDNRKKKVYNINSSLKISFLGPLDKYKGFPLLLESISKLLSEGYTNWELNVYGNNTELALEQPECDHITFHGRYQQGELEHIFDNTDVLIVPSIWKETFGFIGLEALSYGVPVIVSNHVGFKDLIRDGETGVIFNPETKELETILEKLINDRNILKKINQNICNDAFPFSLEKHASDIEALYKEVLGVLK